MFVVSPLVNKVHLPQAWVRFEADSLVDTPDRMVVSVLVVLEAYSRQKAFSVPIVIATM